MPSQPDNLDAEPLSSYPAQSRAVGSSQAGKPRIPLPPTEAVSDALENSTPLETRRVRYVINPNRTASSVKDALPASIPPVAEPIFPTELLRSEPASESMAPTSDMGEQVQEIIVPLLDERLVVDRRRRKVGEVVVRKEIETHIVEVPIRREKLIVEQVSPYYEQLAVVELGAAQMVDAVASGLDGAAQPSVSGSFASASEAMQFLAAIAAEPDAGLHPVQITVGLENATQQALYQRLLEQYSAGKRH